MVAAVSVEELKKALKVLFCEENKANHKYAEVWLSDVDFDGLYYSNQFVVHVKMRYQIPSCNKEINHIFLNLFKRLSKGELALIWRVVVYNADEQILSENEITIVYTALEVC
ncbi:MAG: hypothetical protein EOP42_15490 [Sphingobacteriaceae bacterium]|nr:MAG: hypothetical protein EOP42_15490 [Sphingobacteriaceae bacterium]